MLVLFLQLLCLLQFKRFLGVKFGLEDLLRVKDLTFRNSAFFHETLLSYVVVSG